MMDVLNQNVLMSSIRMMDVLNQNGLARIGDIAIRSKIAGTNPSNKESLSILGDFFAISAICLMPRTTIYCIVRGI